MSDLLVKPIPFNGESPGSLLLRMSELNGWKKATSFLSAHDALNSYDKIESLMIVKESWLKLCSVTGLNCKRSKDIFYGDVGIARRRFVGYVGMKVHWKDLPLKKPKICPQCIKENKFIPKLWDHKLVHMCSKHRVILVTKCENCKQKLIWNRAGLMTCICGEEFKTPTRRSLDSSQILYIESLIKNKDEVSLNTICRFYDAYEYFFKFLKQECDYCDLTKYSIQSFKTPIEMFDLVKKHVELQSELYSIHPRITLIPFLSSKELKLREFGKSMLFKINSYFNGDDYSFEEHTIGIAQVLGALGITKRLTRILIEHGVLEAYRNTKLSKWFIKLCSVNRLLNHLSNVEPNLKQNDFKSIDIVIRTPSFKLDFVTVIKECISNKRKYSMMDMSIGLPSIKIECGSNQKREYRYYKINDVANICNANYENIRFAIKVGILKRIEPKLTKGTIIYIKKLEALKFNDLYIFGGSLAKQYGYNSTNFSEKIKSLGIEPVSGPGIDGGLTYLFKRKDVSQVDYSKIKNIQYYSTNVGRKYKGKKSIKLNYKTVTETSKILGISFQKVVTLIRSGHLHRVYNMHRAGRVSLDSIEQILSMQNNKHLIVLKEASKQVGETEHSFYWAWIESNFIDYINTGLEKYISKSDLKKIIKFKSKYISSVEASEIAGHHRSYLPNLEKQGLIKHKRVLKNRKYSIKFYDRKEVEQIIK